MTTPTAPVADPFATLTPQEVATAQGKGSGVPKITLESIPPSVKNAAVQSYANQDNALRFDFEDEKQKSKFLGLLRRYAELQEPRQTIRTFKDPMTPKGQTQPGNVLVFRAKDLEIRNPAKPAVAAENGASDKAEKGEKGK